MDHTSRSALHVAAIVIAAIAVGALLFFTGAVAAMVWIPYGIFVIALVIVYFVNSARRPTP
jgi:hypothetical protein